MNNSEAADLIACHECDHLHRESAIPPGARADCSYCGALLYKHVPHSLDRSLALYSTALLLLIIANGFPFLALEISGRGTGDYLISGGLALYRYGMGELGMLVFLTSIAIPFIVVLGMLYLLTAAKLGYEPHYMGPVYRLVQALIPWGLIGVFMLASLIAVVKLQDLAEVIPGPALYALAALLVVYSAARASLDPRVLWRVSPHRQLTGEQYPDAGPLLTCHTCGLLRPQSAGLGRCPRCTTPWHDRVPDSITRTWALLVSAAILFIPANVYPVMTVIQFGRGAPDTILSGIVHLIEGGMWGLAMIVFFASIVVPIMKIVVLGFLLVSVQHSSPWRPRDRTRLYRITEVVGAWSMVDVFLVGILCSLVSLDALATIQPGVGAVYFAAVVVITMLAASSFDSRLIWDNAGARPGPAAA